MRKNRVIEQNRCYHLVSRLAHRAFYLDDEEKDRAVALMRRVEAGVQASMSYCINRAVSISSDPFASMQGNPDIEPADFVAANVLGSVLIRFAERIASPVKPGGRIILSGILDELYPEVRETYESLGLGEESSKLIGEWRTGLFVRR